MWEKENGRWKGFERQWAEESLHLHLSVVDVKLGLDLEKKHSRSTY